MPLTLPLDAYSALMGKKGVDAKTSAAHHARMRGMLASFETGGAHVLGPVDVGDDAYWWDYGQLKLYLRNALRLAEDGAEAGAMREFLGVARGGASGAFSVDGKSTTSSCLVQRGTATRSVLANVTAREVEATGCVLVNVTAKKVVAGEGAIAYRDRAETSLVGAGSVACCKRITKAVRTRRDVSRRVFVSSRSVAARRYNVVDGSDAGLVLKAGEVVTDVFMEDGSKHRQRSTLELDGGKTWKQVVAGNKYSFEGMRARRV